MSKCKHSLKIKCKFCGKIFYDKIHLDLQKKLEQLKARCAKYKVVLEQYADENNWYGYGFNTCNNDDDYELAQTVLEEENKG